MSEHPETAQKVQSQESGSKELSNEGFRDPDQAELENKMIKDINNMPTEVQDRFKALKVLYDQVNQVEHEEEKEYRLLEIKYEQKYSQIYDKRFKLVTGKCDIDEAAVKQFDARKDERQKDAKFGEIEVEICDVKEIQNTAKGVSGFWLRAMLANQTIGPQIQEKDRAILAYLIDVRLDLHVHDNGFTLTFEFEPNSYFKNTKLSKTYHMSANNTIEKCEGCIIEWTQGSDPTKMKKKKKQKKGGKKTNVTVTVKCDSFFNFFETVDLESEKEGEGKEDKEEKDEDDPENDIGGQMDADYDTGSAFKDDLIPLALEYYLGVIEVDDDSYGDEHCCDDEHEHDHPAEKKSGKKGGKGSDPSGDSSDPSSSSKGGAGAGEAKPECKQQ